MLMRMIVALGLVMLLATAIFPGSNPAWTALQNSLATGPNWPAGSGLAALTKSVVIHPRANDSWGFDFATSKYDNPPGLVHNEVSPYLIFTDGSDPQCGAGSHVSHVTPYPGQYWHCVVNDDANKSGIILPGLAFTNGDGVTMNGYTWGVRLDNITGIDPQDQIVNITLKVKCNTQTNPAIDFTADIFQNTPVKQGDDHSVIFPDALSIAHMTRVGPQECAYGGIPGSTGVGPNFFPVNLTANFQNGIMVSSQRIGNFSHTTLMINANTWDQDIVITWAEVIVSYLDENASSLNASCNTFDIGCQVAKIWNAIVGTAIFVGAWVWAFITFAVGIIVNFVIGFIDSVIWFNTMPGLGAPTIVKAVVAVPFDGMVAFMLYSILKLLRGGGGT